MKALAIAVAKDLLTVACWVILAAALLALTATLVVKMLEPPPEPKVIACPYPVWQERTEDPEELGDRLALLRGSMEDCAKRMGRQLPSEAPKPAPPAPAGRAL